MDEQLKVIISIMFRNIILYLFIFRELQANFEYPSKGKDIKIQ